MKTIETIDHAVMSKVFQQFHAPLVIVDHHHQVQFVNIQYSQLSGFNKEDIVGGPIQSIVTEYFDHEVAGQREILLKTKDGLSLSYWATVTHIEVEPQVNYSVIYLLPCEQCGIDPLTKLPNRSSFERSMRQLITNARENDSFFAFLFMDLDRFKFVNDTLGHSCGDELLKQVANRIQGVIPKDHLLTRIGGDEFICVIKDIQSEKDGEDVAQDILNLFKTPFLLRGIEIYITVSIGIAFFPYDGDDLEMLMTNADSAMYRAKKNGKNQFEKAGVEISAGSFEKLLIENSLRKSIENDELFLQFQPQVDLKTNEVVAFEALVRWNHPELGIVPPNEFIPIAEETGLIIQIGDWVIQTACQKLKEWEDEGYGSIRMSVNLTVQEFLQHNFVEKIHGIVTEEGIKPSQLELELTESMFMHDIDIAIAILEKLRSLGFRISIDDFGTGFSSLSYLQKLPVNNLKIDRAFIKDIDTNQSSKTLTQTITSLAHDLNLEVVVEGVETLNQLVQVKKSSCDMVQGFYFSKPLQENKVIDFLKQQNKQIKLVN